MNKQIVAEHHIVQTQTILSLVLLVSTYAIRSNSHAACKEQRL